MLYIILNDGETYTAVEGSIIFDSVTQKVYSIRRSKQIGNRNTTVSWEKGMDSIIEDEYLDSVENNVDIVKGCLDDKGVVKPMTDNFEDDGLEDDRNSE